MERKTISVDFDDVVLQFHATFMVRHNQLYGTALTYDDLNNYEQWEKMYGCDAATMTNRAIDFYRSPEHDLIEPIPGALDALQSLANDYDLDIVTSRPDFTEPIVRAWLDKNLPDAFRNIHFTNTFAGVPGTTRKKKSEVCLAIGAAVHIDDALHHATDVAQQGVPALLPDRPWNREAIPEGVHRMHSWDEIVSWIRKNV